jgi:hypothetical protein
MASSPSAHAPVFSEKAANGPTRRRRNLLVALASVVAVGVGAAVLSYEHWNPRGTSSATAPDKTHVTPADATKCLTADRALVNPMSGGRDFPTASAFQVSFALVPARRLDSAILFFEPNRATAQRELAALAVRQKPNVSTSLFNSYFQIKNNVVVFWGGTKLAPTSRAAVLGCLS